MLQKEWPVLIVDDEPDVLAVTRLALKGVDVDGVPLKLHTARSKAEAIELLTESAGPPGPSYYAVALIDVVMETPSAGLEVCDFVRNNLRNKTTQLYIRTGQAGLAPERSVVDRYDISGYFTKVEVTDDKLYSVVKAGVRQNEFLTTTQVLFQILTRAAGRSRAEISRMLGGFSAFMLSNHVTVGIVVGGEVLIAIGTSDQDLVAECRRLNALAGTTLSSAGDKVVYENRSALFCSADDEDYLLFGNVSQPNPAIQSLDMSYLKVLAALVKAGADVPQRSAV